MVVTDHLAAIGVEPEYRSVPKEGNAAREARHDRLTRTLAQSKRYVPVFESRGVVIFRVEAVDARTTRTASTQPGTNSCPRRSPGESHTGRRSRSAGNMTPVRHHLPTKPAVTRS